MKSISSNILLSVVALLLVVILTTAYSTRQVLTEKHQAYSVKTHEIKSTINKNLVEAQAFVFSIAQLYQFTDTIESEDIDLLLESKETAHTAITRIGRFDKVELSKINQYLLSMKESGIYSYKLKSLENEVVDLTSPGKDHSNDFVLPIASTFPYTVSSTKLLGIDLGSNSILANIYLQSAANNQSQFLPAPENWDIEGNLILLQPTYLGRYISEDINKRVSESDGGFIVNIDIASKLKTLINETNFNATLFIESLASTNHLPVNALSKINNDNLEDLNSMRFEDYINGYKKQETIESGNLKLVLGFNTPSGLANADIKHIFKITTGHLLKVLPFAFLLFLISRILIHEKFSKQQLVHARKRAFNIIQAIEDMVLTVDRNGIVKSTNPEATANLGSIVGKSVASVINVKHDNGTDMEWDRLNPRLTISDAEKSAPTDTSRLYTNCILQIGNDKETRVDISTCLLYTSPSPRDATLSRMPSSA